MNKIDLSKKGKKLIQMYKKMHRSGYKTARGDYIYPAYERFNMKAFKKIIKLHLDELGVKTILDYGSGGSDWNKVGFDKDTNLSAIKYFNLKSVYKFEPGRNIDQRKKADCVIVFDVLEHIYINDIKKVLFDIFNYAKKIVIINVACYDSAALLPNGENAHVTVRYPLWWKGVLDVISMDYINVKVLLICSTGIKTAEGFKIWSGKDWDDSESIVTKLGVK